MSEFKKENQILIAYVRVFELEAKKFLRGACCPQHAWMVVEMLRGYRRNIKEPLLRLAASGHPSLFDEIGMDDVIASIGRVRLLSRKASTTNEVLLVTGTRVCQLMEEHGDMREVVDILASEVKEKIASLPHRHGVNSLMFTNDPVEISMPDPGTIN